MKILGLDSSGLVASAAVVENDILLAEYTTNYKKTHSQTLLPMLDEIRSMIDLDLESIDAIAIAAGPGSFTGLRIGSATVKGLGLALDKDIIGVPTVEGLAMNLYETDAVICPMMDARRNQVYTGIYKFQNGTLQVVKDQIPLGIEDIIEALNTIGQKVIFLGDGVPVYKEVIEKNMAVPYSFAPAHMNKQRAGAMGARAFEYYKQSDVLNIAILMQTKKRPQENLRPQNYLVLYKLSSVNSKNCYQSHFVQSVLLYLWAC